MKLDYPEGATPLDPNEMEGLLLSVSTQKDLNALEKANIRSGVQWAYRSRKLRKFLLSFSGLMLLHQKTFGEVWRWAGIPRTAEKNIGIPPHQISEELGKLCADTQYWIENRIFNWDEIAVRFHHRLVFIHSFVNGNGRHARIATDLLLKFNSCKEFTWGATDLVSESVTRSAYIGALKQADKGDYSKLLAFVRS